MTKTQTKLTIMLLAFCFLLFAFFIFIPDASIVRAEPATATEATDVYWYVHEGKLLLSSEQGSSGFYKWSKESIAAVKNESDVPWNSSRASITDIIIYSPIAPPSYAFWFKDTNLTSFSAAVDGTVYFDFSNATDVSRMFAGCSLLEELDLSSVNAPLVKSIESAFDGCSSITSLDISCFDGAPLTNMMNAFYGCSNLKELDLTGLDISRVTDFTGVFLGCAALKSLDLSKLDGRNITTLEDSFNGCTGLTSLTFGDGFTCENVTNMKNTFKQCKSLTALDISGFSTAKVTDMSSTFSSCEALSELTLGESFDCSKVTSMEAMFGSCKSLKSIDTSGWGAVGVKNMRSLFSNCTSLESVDLSGFSGAKPTEIRSMFSNAQSLKSVDISMLNTSEVTSLYNLFNGCSSLEAFDLSSINTSSVTIMENVFYGCTSLTSFSFVGVNTSKVENMHSMFHGCENLQSVDFTGIDTGKVTDIGYMFAMCKKMKRLDLSDFDVTEGLAAGNLIRNCFALEMIYAPKVIPESVSFSLSPFTFYTGEEEITELTSTNQGTSVVRKYEIKYARKNGTQTTSYNFEPNYYYYGYGAKISAEASENGYVFEGWTRVNSDVILTEITPTDTGDVTLYAKLTAYQPVAPVISASDDVIVTYGEGFEVNFSFTEDEHHTYWIEWYRTLWRGAPSGFNVTELRNTRGFTINPKSFNYGIAIEEEVYFYCIVTATRKDNGISTTVTSPSVKVYVKRAQAEITLHPTAIEGLIYDGSAQQVATPGESSFGNIHYSIYESEGYTTGGIKQKNAGTRILYYYVPESTYYKGTEVYRLEYKIEAATPIVSWENESLTVDYTGVEAVIGSPSVLLLNSDVYDGTVSYSYTGTSSGTGLPVNAGTYNIIASIEAGGNYKAACYPALTLTISKVAPEFAEEPRPNGLIYNGENQALVSLGSAIGGIVEFSLDGSAWSSNVPKGKDAADYTVYYRIKGDNNHLDTTPTSLKASIGRKNITVTADNKTICVNDAYTLTYSTEGLVSGDTLPIEVALDTEANVEALGEYTVTASGAKESGNYSISYENGTLTVRSHEYESAVTTAPTCSTVGTKTFTCTHNSAHTYTEDVAIDGNAHSWNEGEITTAPTCSTVGTKTYTCTHNSEHTYTEDVAIDENAHSWNEGTVITNPTCSAIGTVTYTCTHNSLHTKTEDVAIDGNAHSWNEGEITTAPTCSTVGTKTFTCTHNSAHTYTEDVAALGHKYDNACDTNCNTCGEERTPAKHYSENADGKCDECGAELPKDGISGGAIAGIAVGSTAAVGLGSFSLFWFVIKKKKWSDLIGIFKK